MSGEGYLLTASEAAQALGATSQTIRNWIRAERLGAVRIGHRFLIARSEVERLRGEVGAPVGESPWEFSAEASATPLVRPSAGVRRESPSSGEMLGG